MLFSDATPGQRVEAEGDVSVAFEKAVRRKPLARRTRELYTLNGANEGCRSSRKLRVYTRSLPGVRRCRPPIRPSNHLLLYRYLSFVRHKETAKLRRTKIVAAVIPRY